MRYATATLAICEPPKLILRVGEPQRRIALGLRPHPIQSRALKRCPRGSSCATKKRTPFWCPCTELKMKFELKVSNGIHFASKMHFTEPYASKLTTAFGSCPNPIFVATKKEAREPLFEQNKKGRLCAYLFVLAQEEGFEPPWLLA